MKKLFIPLIALLLAIGCTKDSTENGSDGGNGGNGMTDYVPTGTITVKGKVYGSDGPLKGVVVSDGLLAVRTNDNGYYEIDTNLDNAKFIMVSIPSGYTAPLDSNKLPIFYHRVTDDERKAKLCQVTFNLEKITDSDPNRYTMIIGADPQPRSSNKDLDKVAFPSLVMCENLYRDIREKAATITDRNVYGMMLGDIVHEDMSLFDTYITDGLSTLGFPMFNILGNHDNDKTAKTDAEGRRSFEEKLGPTYYSFNIGKQHYVVLDNLIMKLEGSELTGYDQGLTDEIWQWLQNDLQYVDFSTTIMVAAHSPMFMLPYMSDRSSGASGHRSDYALLLSKYAKVHAWAGHSHTTFNYNYPESHKLKNIEVHTVARSTGELWTNEWQANSTPRGYTVVEVDGDEISWYFKPTIYQQKGFSGKTSPQPEYKYRDWDFKDGIATMRSDGSILSEAYQMKVYKPGEYNDKFSDMYDIKTNTLTGKATNKYIYVDVFLWDDKWEKPKYNGATMSQVGYKDAYSLMDFEIKYHYFTNGYKLKDYDGYGPNDNDTHTIFRAYESKSSGSGTVTVKDRFGNEYSQSVTW